MKKNRLKIGAKLTLSFGVILILVAIMGVIGLALSLKIWDNTQNMYEHPLQVRRAIGDIRADVFAMSRAMKSLALSKNQNEADQSMILFRYYENDLKKAFTIVFDRYLGPKTDIDTAYTLCMEYITISEESMHIWKSGDYENAVERITLQGVGGAKVSEAIAAIQKISDFAKNKAIEFYQKAEIQKNQIVIIISASLILILFIAFITGILIYRNISRPLVQLSETAARFTSGDYDARSSIDRGDEIGALANSFNRLAERAQDEISLKSAAAAIAEALSFQNDLPGFCKTLIDSLVISTGSQMGAIYFLNPDSGVFEHNYSIGMKSDRTKNFSAFGLEGEFGKVLTEKKIQHLKNIPGDTVCLYPAVSGTYVPREILSLPLIEKDEVFAVISLASLNGFTTNSLRLASDLQIIMTSRFQSILAYRKISEYSERLDRQNAELEERSRELSQQTDELKEYNIELEMQKKQLNENNRLKSEFLSNMSHELRTPLNSILALSGILMSRSRGKLSDEEAGYLEVIERNGRNLLNLINEILDLSRIESGKMELNIQTIHAGPILRDIVENLKPLALKKNIGLDLIISQHLPMVETDPDRLMQIMTNIIHNAVKFTDKGSVSVVAKAAGDHIEIEVNDTGIGIPRDEIPYIFDKFRQLDGSSSRRFEGTGLGLSIVHELLKKTGGSIRVNSEPGSGSKFVVSIPLSWSQPLPDADAAIETPADVKSEKLILVVDDDENANGELATLLRDAGYQTVSVLNGSDVVELAIKYKPFAITLDIIMPDADGWEVLGQLKENPGTRSIPVIMVSVSDEKETGAALGAHAHLTKPVKAEALLGILSGFVHETATVLVTDDNPVDLQLVSEILEDKKLRVVRATSGEECLKLAREVHPDLFILDLIMPGTDGFMVLKQLREMPEFASKPVIILTAKDLTAEEKIKVRGNLIFVLAKDHAGYRHIYNEIENILSLIPAPAMLVPETGKQKRILIVEDNPEAIMQIKSVLEEENYLVDVAKGGQEAIDFVKHTIPDGIILDLMMPGIDGFEVLETIRGTSRTARIPVLILTARDLDRNDLKRLSANNIQQLVQKGAIDLNGLLRKISTMLSSKTTVSEIQSKKSNVKVPSLLVVEDNPDNLLTLKAILSEHYKIEEQTDGEGGLKAALEGSYDAILLDIALPKISGTEILRQIRMNERIKGIPVIAVTARAMKGDQEELLSAGFDAYISKPVDGEKLLNLLNKMIRS